MSNTKAPVSIFTGQRAQVRMVSRTWGVGSPALVEGVDFTPNISKAMVLAFGSLTPVLNYTTFDDVTAKLTYPQSNQAVIEALLMDYDQSQDLVIVNPAQLAPFQLFANLNGLDGKVKGCYFLRGCTATGNPFSSTIKDSAKRTLDFQALNAYFIHGAQLNYTRFRGTKTQIAVPAVPTLATSTTGGSLVPGDYYLQITAVTSEGETPVSPEAKINIPAGTSTNKITVTTPTITTPVTAYNIYMFNYSNGERYATQCASGTSTDILVVPSGAAALPPKINTTGPAALTGDVVLSSGAGTFPTAAASLPQTGLQYIQILKNGAEIANVDNPALNGNFIISADGTTFTTIDSDSDYSWYDVFTISKA